MIRGGLCKDYISVEETSNVIKGKIDINVTIKKNTLVNKKVAVVYEEFSENVVLNQIIKATLIAYRDQKSEGIHEENIKKLKESHRTPK